MSDTEAQWKQEFHQWTTRYMVDWKTQYDDFLRTINYCPSEAHGAQMLFVPPSGLSGLRTSQDEGASLAKSGASPKAKRNPNPKAVRPLNSSPKSKDTSSQNTSTRRPKQQTLRPTRATPGLRYRTSTQAIRPDRGRNRGHL